MPPGPVKLSLLEPFRRMVISYVLLIPYTHLISTSTFHQAPTSVGNQSIVAVLPTGTKCAGGASKNLCLASFTTAAGFGNCVVVEQGGAIAGSTATTPPPNDQSATSSTANSTRPQSGGGNNNGHRKNHTGRKGMGATRHGHHAANGTHHANAVNGTHHTHHMSETAANANGTNHHDMGSAAVCLFLLFIPRR